MNSASSGKGWKFPVLPDPVTGRMQMSGLEDDIAEAIKLIVRTSPGERVMREDFGCGVQQHVFGIPDLTSLFMIETSIVEALQLWEPRITNIEVTAQPDPIHSERLRLTIRYVVKLTNRPDQLEYAYDW
ncbi:phage baseplate assembly protein W [Paenibacillus mucilaginosus]|uniref:GPW/gp25 family protein n=1 Tax=Paenibacillus mucilaginosus TaxID=61624 RepID=UPI003D1FBDA3